ncbi:MAG TPA: NUDIX domain-containing protein [Patescibacteria group bacterium]|nr:NUDIX domain-containing protein [Patescibacteria group bacterium]
MKRVLAKVWRFCHLAPLLQLHIMRLTNDQFLIGVTGIFFNDKDQVLLVKHTYRQIPWSLPGGYLKAKEHPMEGLEREVLEETGLVVSADKQLKLRTDRTTGRIDILYTGTFIGGEFQESEEVSECGFFSFDTLPVILKDQVVSIDYAIQQRKKMHSHKTPFFPAQSTHSSIFQQIGAFLRGRLWGEKL